MNMTYNQHSALCQPLYDMSRTELSRRSRDLKAKNATVAYSTPDGEIKTAKIQSAANGYSETVTLENYDWTYTWDIVEVS